MDPTGPAAQLVPVVVEASEPMRVGHTVLPMQLTVSEPYSAEILATYAIQPGTNRFDLPRGRHLLTFSCRSGPGKQAGRARLALDTRDGVPVHCHYAAPRGRYDAGAAGLEPQHRRWAVTLLVLLGYLALCAVVTVWIVARG